MKTKQIILLSVAGLLAVILGVSGFLLFRGIREFGREEQALDRAVKTLENYYARDPFPSPENEQREQDNIRVLQEWFVGLVGALRRGQAEPTPLTPSNFIRLFSKSSSELNAMAQAHKTAVPESFAYGFDRYSASGVLPAPPDVPRLAQQLAIVDAVGKVLFESGIRELVEVRREEFESAAAGGASAAPTVSRFSRFGTTATAEGGQRDWTAKPTAGELTPGALYTGLRFGFRFRSGEDAVLKVLNALAAQEMFCVVTYLSVEKEPEDVLAAPSKKVDVTTPEAERKLAVPPRRQRVVSGPAVEKPMNVDMEVVVFRFAGEEPGSGA
jgi:hypothetical protein